MTGNFPYLETRVSSKPWVKYTSGYENITVSLKGVPSWWLWPWSRKTLGWTCSGLHPCAVNGVGVDIQKPGLGAMCPDLARGRFTVSSPNHDSPWRRDRLPSSVFLGFLGSSDSESTCSVEDLGSIPGLGRSPGGGCGNPFSTLAWRIPMDRGAWRTIVHAVTKDQTQLSYWAAMTQVCEALSNSLHPFWPVSSPAKSAKAILWGCSSPQT